MNKRKIFGLSLGLIVGIFGALALFNTPLISKVSAEVPTPTRTEKTKSFNPTGWAGWSCPLTEHVVDAGVLVGTANVYLWQPGATAPGVAYPNTPFGYTYVEGETGMIIQNDGDKNETITYYVDCLPNAKPIPRLTFICKAPEDGKANAYISSSKGFTPVSVSAGDYLFRVTNSGTADITSYEVKLGGNIIYTGGSVVADGYDFFIIKEAMAGLSVYAQPSGSHGTASTNELEKQTCEMVKEEEPEPTPTPTETPKQEVKVESSPSPSIPSAPQCTDGNTVKLPANPHVIRKGSQAIVNWFETEGDEANIYFKEVDSNVWTHAVRDIKVTGGYASVTINDLKPNLGYTFGIEQKIGCAGGQLVIAVIVDGPESQTFGFSYWEWGK